MEGALEAEHQRRDLLSRSMRCPCDQFGIFCPCRAELSRFRGDSDPQQVKAIGIPADLNRRIGLGQTFRVRFTSVVQQIEIRVRELKVASAVAGSQLSAPLAMTGIDVIVHSAGVVEQGEEKQDGGIGGRVSGQPQAVLVDARPVADAVQAAPVECILAANCPQSSSNLLGVQVDLEATVPCQLSK